MKSIRAISPTRIIELYGGTSSDLNEREGGGQEACRISLFVCDS